MELHTCLWSDVTGFDFVRADFQMLEEALPDLTLVVHDNEESFLSNAEAVEHLLAWEFPEHWYERCPRLQFIMTPAAGRDWIASDPKDQVTIVHGNFHGEIMAESMLSALLYMNHRMPLVVESQREKAWNRNLQHESRLLRHQKVAIIGFGSIGQICGKLIKGIGAEVIGVRRSEPGVVDGIPVTTLDQLPDVLADADHIVLVLPGVPETDNFLNEDMIKHCKPGVFLYNFGRGNALTSETVEKVAANIGGVFLDVTDEEPLPADSPIWEIPNVVITPHTSCIYREYKIYFMEEVIARIKSGKTG